MTVAVAAASDPERRPTCAFPSQDLGRPIRVVFFGGAFLEPAAREFLARLTEHPEVALMGAFCQSSGLGLEHVIADVVRRRRWLAPAVLAAYGARQLLRFAADPRAEWRLRRRARRAQARMIAVPDIHAPAVLQQVRALIPDLGLVYGAPVLRQELFEIPAYGTIGIHHGKLPRYRGKKLTLWAMLNGDATTGVTIQRINRGIDTGDILSASEIAIAGRRYGRVDADVQQRGVHLFMSAVLAVKSGRAVCAPQPAGVWPLYRQPAVRDIVRLWWRRAPKASSTR